MTGCDGISLEHPLNSIVYQVWPVEVDSDLSLDLWYINNGNKVEYIDFRRQPDLPMFFSLISDSLADSQRKYVFIYGYGSNQDQFRLSYYRKCVDMVEADDECMLPDSGV